MDIFGYICYYLGWVKKDGLLEQDMQLNGTNASRIVVEGQPKKINPNGFDVGVSEVWKINDSQTVVIHGKQRESSLPKQKVLPSDDGFYYLERGIYEVRLDVKIKIPNDVVVYFFPRSTLNRFGMVKSETAVGDSGYEGYCTQTFYIPFERLKIHKDEAWVQVVVHKSEPVEVEYDGFWQGETKK